MPRKPKLEEMNEPQEVKKSFREKLHDFFLPDRVQIMPGMYVRMPWAKDDPDEYTERVPLPEGVQLPKLRPCANCGAYVTDNGRRDKPVKCPCCGEFLTDEVPETLTEAVSEPEERRGFDKAKASTLFFFCLAIAGFVFLYAEGGKPSVPCGVYVPVLDRTCPWNLNTGAYYDRETGCSFRKSEADPSVWQYRYDRIAADFEGDGWMQYNFEENRWYIENQNQQWEPLPEEYAKTLKWAFAEE